MIEIRVKIDEIDYDTLFDAYFDQVRDSLAESGNPAASLLARVPDGLVRAVWNGMNDAQKDSVAALLLRAVAEREQGKIMARLKEKKINFRLKEYRVNAEKDE